MILSLILFIAGIVLLVKGADFLVDGASDFAENHGISRWVIGVTIVAFGTSLPELSVAIIAALNGLGDLAFGNVVGSNIGNIGLVVGLSALILPIPIKELSIRKEMLFLLISSFVLLVLPFKYLLGDPTEPGVVGRVAGIILLAILGVFMYYIVTLAKSQRSSKKKVQRSWKNTGRDFGYIILGIIGTLIGGKLVVDSGIIVARTMGISDAVIGLTLVAIGTSVPELATSVVAALKGKVDVSLGNIVGSNILNIVWVLGTAAVFAPFTISPKLILDVLVMVLFSFGLLFVISTSDKVTRTEGLVLLVGYLAYIATLF